MAATAQFYEIRDFAFHDGTTLPSVRVAYLDLNPTASKTALVITCFRGRLRSTQTFAAGALRDHRIIVAALFGNGESSSPSNTSILPSGTGTAAKFPTLNYRDCVRAQHALLAAHLGIQHLDLVLGFSMGGQCAYHWTLMYPSFVGAAVIICSSARTSRHNYQFLEGPKCALLNAVDFNDDSASSSSAVESSVVPRGVHAFGKAYSAWLTSAEWFDTRAYRSLGYKTLRDWDRDTTGVNYAGWHPHDLLVKLRMWQSGDVTTLVEAGGGKEEEEEEEGEGGEASLQKALSQIRARVLLMPCRTDQYFRWEASEREARFIPDARLRVIPSVWGHIAGGGANKEDVEWMDREIVEFLRG